MTKILKLNSGETYVGNIVEETDDEVLIQYPLLVEHKYNTEQQPVFRYLPWQILSDEKVVSFSKSQIVYSSIPKVDLIDVYEKINISFVPLEDEEMA